MIGQVVGAYRITAMVGEGGMGSVYLAVHSLIGHEAAIKVLKPEYSHRPEVVERFFNEARAASGIRHPGIVEIYDFGYHSGNAAYIVMEHLHGESLEARLRRLTRLPVDHALYLIRHVTSGLAAAHDQTIVHRDLKPDNIFVVPDPDMPAGERTKILDFGIAKLTSQTPGSFKTSTGTVMGTPAYMAPEQCKGAGRVDNRADLYALGCILFEMLCGRPPFVAEGGGEVMAQHIYELPPSPRGFDPSLSVDLEALVLRLLAKDPDARPQSAREVLSIVDGLLAGLRPTTAPGVSEFAFRATTPTPSPPAHTTLGGAARSVPPTAPGKRRSGYLLPLLAGITIAGAIGIFALLRGDDPQVAGAGAPPPDGASERAAAPIADAAAPEGATADAAPARAAPSGSAEVTIVIESKPKQAEVYRMPAMIRVGPTPYRLAIPPTDGELVFVVQKRGYDTATVVLPADRDGHQVVELRRTTTGRRDDRPATAVSPNDPTKPPADKPPVKPPVDKPPMDKPPADKPPVKPPADKTKPPEERVLDPFEKQKPKGRALDPFSK